MILRGHIHEHVATREAWAVALVRLSADPERDSSGSALADTSPLTAVEGALVTCVGDRLGLVEPEQGLELRGEWETSRYGPQFRVVSQTVTGITAAPQAQRWLERMDGVGPVLARAIHAALGEQLVTTLHAADRPASLAALAAIRGVSPAKAEAILDSFASLGSSKDLEALQYLDGLGCTRWEAAQVLAHAKRCGLTPQRLLAEQPYSLLDAHGLGWAKVDKIASFAGTPREAPARLEAGICCVLDSQVQEGSTMIRMGHLVRVGAESLEVSGDMVAAAVARCAASGRVVLAAEDGVTWVHPAGLYHKERAIYEAALGSTRA